MLAIVRLHDGVLADNHAAWDDPPRAAVRWSEERKAQLRAVVAHYQGRRMWGFKDPRTLFTLDGWLEVLPELCFLGTFRHPEAVYRSLHRRNGMDRAQAYDLWCRYNGRLLAYWDRFRFPVVNFSLPQDAYIEAVQRAFRSLGISCATVRLSFFDGALRQNEPAAEVSLPPDVEQLHQRLLAAAI